MWKRLTRSGVVVLLCYFVTFILSHLIHALHSARMERSIRRTGSLIRARRCAVSARMVCSAASRCHAAWMAARRAGSVPKISSRPCHRPALGRKAPDCQEPLAGGQLSAHALKALSYVSLLFMCFETAPSLRRGGFFRKVKK